MGKKSKKKPVSTARSKPATRPGQPPADLSRMLASPRPITSADIKTVGLVALLALAVRLAFYFINKSSNPLFDHLVLDAAFHHEWANDILHLDFWGDEVFFRAPFYAYFLAALHAISGANIPFAILVQHLLGVGTVIAVYMLARRYFAPNVALVAGVIASLYWPLIYFEGDLLIVTLFVFIMMVMLLTISIAIARQSTLGFIASGVLLGLAATTRPSILAVAPLLPWVFSMTIKGQGKRWLRPSILVAGAALLMIAPITIRNFMVGQDFVPIASQGGVNFYIGNNDRSNGTQAIVPGVRGDLAGTHTGAIAQAEQEVGHPLKPSQVSNHYLKKALRFMLQSPGAAATLTAKKFYYFWGGVERANNKYIQFFWREYGLGRVPLPGFWFVGPLGLLGGFLLWRRRRELSLLYVYVIAYAIGVIIFFVNARFRLPVMPVMIIFAAYALTYLFLALRQKHPARLSAIGVLAITTLFVNYDYMNFRGFRAFDEAVTRYELGNAYMATERLDRALAEYEAAYDISTRYPTRGFDQIEDFVDFQIGAICWEKGLVARAIEALERVDGNDAAMITRAKFMLADAHLEAARTLDRKQDYAAAARHYRQASQDTSVRRDALLDLARLYAKTDQRDAATELFNQLAADYPTDRVIQAEVRGHNQQRR